MIRKTVCRSLAAVAAVAALGLASDPASATSQTGNASATILTQISVTAGTAMAFGSIAPAAAGGAVVLQPNGTIPAVAGFAFGGSPAAGTFTVSGASGQPVNISFSSGNTLTGPGTAMPLGTFTTTGAPATFGASSFTLNVGATLTVNANQTAGSYNGTYTVSVDY
jgi:hypothetical protein